MKRVEGRAQVSSFKVIMEFLTKIRDFINNENQNVLVDQNINRNRNQFTENDQRDNLNEDVVIGGDAEAEDMDGIEGMTEEEKKVEPVQEEIKATESAVAAPKLDQEYKQTQEDINELKR